MLNVRSCWLFLNGRLCGFFGRKTHFGIKILYAEETTIKSLQVNIINEKYPVAVLDFLGVGNLKSLLPVLGNWSTRRENTSFGKALITYSCNKEKALECGRESFICILPVCSR